MVKHKKITLFTILSCIEYKFTVLLIQSFHRRKNLIKVKLISAEFILETPAVLNGKYRIIIFALYNVMNFENGLN